MWDTSHPTNTSKEFIISIPNTKVPDVSPGFDPDSGTDDNALFYTSITPNHDDHNLNMDGVAKT